MPLSKWLRSFPPMAALHPFEAALLDLTIGAATYASVLGKVDTLRKALQEVRVQDTCVQDACRHAGQHYAACRTRSSSVSTQRP